MGYDCCGERLDYFPSNSTDQAACTPVYEEMPGWQESTYGARTWADLPVNALKYIRRVEELTRIPSDVQDTLITILSEKILPVPELNTEVQAQRGFNLIATANDRDKGVNELSKNLMQMLL